MVMSRRNLDPKLPSRNLGATGLEILGLDGPSLDEIADNMGVPQLADQVEANVTALVGDLSQFTDKVLQECEAARTGLGLSLDIQSVEAISSLTSGIPGPVGAISAGISLVTGLVSSSNDKDTRVRTERIERGLKKLNGTLQEEMARAIKLLAQAGDQDAIDLLDSQRTGPRAASAGAGVVLPIVAAAVVLPALLGRSLRRRRMGRLDVPKFIAIAGIDPIQGRDLLKIHGLILELGIGNNQLEDALGCVPADLVRAQAEEPAEIQAVKTAEQKEFAEMIFSSFNFPSFGGLRGRRGMGVSVDDIRDFFETFGGTVNTPGEFEAKYGDSGITGLEAMIADGEIRMAEAGPMTAAGRRIAGQLELLRILRLRVSSPESVTRQEIQILNERLPSLLGAFQTVEEKQISRARAAGDTATADAFDAERLELLADFANSFLRTAGEFSDEELRNLRLSLSGMGAAVIVGAGLTIVIVAALAWMFGNTWARVREHELTLIERGIDIQRAPGVWDAVGTTKTGILLGLALAAAGFFFFTAGPGGRRRGGGGGGSAPKEEGFFE